MVTVATGFSRHLDRFRSQWTSLWALPAEGRSRVADQVLALQAAQATHDSEAQRRIVDNVDDEIGASAPHGTMALSILDYVAHLWRQSSESEDEMISEFQRLGFFDEGDREAQAQGIRGFFVRLSETDERLSGT